MKYLFRIIPVLLLPSVVGGQQNNFYLNSLHQSLVVSKSDTSRMDTYHKLGTYFISEDRDSAIFYFEKALPVATKLNLKFDEASILTKIGIILMQQEKFSKSLEFYLRALNIAKEPAIEKTIWNLTPGQSQKKERLTLISSCYDLIGILNAYTGNWTVNTKNQLKYYKEAEKYAKEAGDTVQGAYITFHMGISYMADKKLDSAISLYNNAISTFSDLKDHTGLGRAMKYLGDAYGKKGDLNLAAKTILQSVTHLKETNDYVHIALAYISLNHVYTGLNKKDSALYYAKESLRIFQKRKDPFGKKDAYDLLSSSFDNLGQPDSAIVYLRLAKSLSDSLSMEERKNLLEFQDVVVNEQAKFEKLEKERIEARGKLRTYLLMSGIIIFSVIVLLLYRNNQHRKKTNETLQIRNEEIERTLQQLKSTQSQLIRSEKMASLGELTAGIAHEIQNPLNFVNNFSEVNKELAIELEQEIEKGNYTDAKAIARDIKDNEEKINRHGKRADGIVKSMLLHSQKSLGQKELTDINALCDEYLRLAYHGLKAKDKSFNAKFETDFDSSLPKVKVIPQDLGRVMLNLLNNAFYAVNERSKKGEAGYQPTVTVATKIMANNQLQIVIKDNGPGIPESIKDKIFQPFFTTKPTGQGTGLGLSLSYDLVKAQGGELKVETKMEEQTKFIIELNI